jgi:hypothetical protein
MLIHEISSPPTPALQAALAAYESKFLYPLADGVAFRIDHGPDRTAFLRSLGGDWCLLAAESNGMIRGTADLTLCQVQAPGSQTAIPAVFCNEIRLLEEARRKTVAARLLQHADSWYRARAGSILSIVNDTNTAKPSAYTGRLGITPLRHVSAVSHIRIPLADLPLPSSTPATSPASDQVGLDAFARLSTPFHRVTPTSAHARSMLIPQWFLHPSGAACARIEDRRKTIRLITTSGIELRPAFLSCFAYSDPAAAADLLHATCAAAIHSGFNALRFCIPSSSLPALRAACPFALPAAPAAVYASASIPSGTEWLINASEM